jgi:adenine-specific DNA-methyltransferase
LNLNLPQQKQNFEGKEMKKLSVEDPETKSPDLIAGNVEQLKSLFPEAFTEGKVDFEVLKQLLGGAVDERDEKYGLNWHGKRRARQLALTPSNGTLRPSLEDSVDWDTTRNLMIEGDNLEVLKLLQKSYAGKVKLIYIDPPYNTGNDFIYPDNFQNNIRNYLELTAQVDSNGNKISSNTEASGRFHTDWLNMIYPRLRLARNLLGEDGAIFISIDDNEFDNLRKVCDEIFGPENFVATAIWQKVFSPKNTAAYFSEDHDYILVYAKQKEIWEPRLLPRSDETVARYTNPDNDPRGPWMSGAIQARNYYSKGQYEVTSPSGKKFSNPKGTYWRFSFERFQGLDKDNRIWWGETKDGVPRLKRFLSEVKDGVVPQTLWKYEDVGHTQEAKEELLKYVDFANTENILNSVKPTRLLRHMLRIGTSPNTDDLVLDFFAGSGSTGHAVLAQNAEDGGKRRFILVQLPEALPSPEKNVATIADLAKSRIRNVSKYLVEHSAESPKADPPTHTDFGFRVFKLASSNIRVWEPNAENLPNTLENSVEHLKTDRTEEDILFELLLKLGLDLNVPIERKDIAAKTVHSIGAGTLLVCLAKNIGGDEVEPLALGVAAWHNELAPAGETTVVFRDSGFADDVAKTNLTAILEQNGISNIRSL